MPKSLRFPVYDAKEDGNVFDWILLEAECLRRIRQTERDNQLRKQQAEKRNDDNR